METALSMVLPGTPETGQVFSYALDVWVADLSILTDKQRLVGIMRAAAAGGGAVVLGETTHTFPNGAVTAVLLLSESHLSVHTWPERGVAIFDLLTCGRMSGERILADVEAAMTPVRSSIGRAARDLNLNPQG